MDISTNGTFVFDQAFKPGRLVIMDICGPNFGGATVTPGFVAGDGDFSPYLQADSTPVTLTARGGFQVRVPRDGRVGIKVENGSEQGVSIVLDVIHAVDMPPGS